ncbi:hypothetical protein PYW07_015961 [Mythimna separata]|uniref:Uncharacterized protein n=1 Tax=Mythimna separata TaxID=271217 RepID=A0AAD7YR19_MYTSE|nr:hypothetical protein PYW07_015961 [Mythimna separata]
MVGNEGGGDNPPTSHKRPRPEAGGGGTEMDCGDGGGGERFDYSPYIKPDYKRLYPENATYTEFKVFIEATNNKDRVGNKSPIYLNHIFSSEIKGVTAIQRINANKIAVIFKQYNTANNFINNTTFLNKHEFKAFIPAAQIEKTGIIRFVPANISNRELYTKLSSIYEIIAIRRFTKKVGQQRLPLQTVSITFLSNILPDNVQYDLFSYRVFEYVPPLQQCFRCFKFNHSARICNGKQRCSICGGEHLYKECDKPTEICCVNCSGPHLAISRLCPIKMKKILEKKNKITYASATMTKQLNNDIEFPPLSPPKIDSVHKPVNKPVHAFVNKPVSVNKPVHNVNKSKVVPPKEDIKAQIVANNDVLMALVQTLVELGNKGDNTPTTMNSIREALLKNLK